MKEIILVQGERDSRMNVSTHPCLLFPACNEIILVLQLISCSFVPPHVVKEQFVDLSCLSVHTQENTFQGLVWASFFLEMFERQEA